MKFITVIILGLPIVFLLEIPASFWITGNNIQVLDGDTIKFTMGRNLYSGRILYIDAPEKEQMAGILADNFLKNYLNQNKVEIKIAGQDIYNRKLVHLKVRGELVSFELIKRGLVVLYPFSKFEDKNQKFKFLEAQNLARKKRIGIWREPFVNPYHWRKCRKLASVKNCELKFARSLKKKAPHAGGAQEDIYLVKNF